jgi:predicted PurR-regulated permease PerM
MYLRTTRLPGAHRASFVRVLRVLAMTVIVLVGVRLAAPVLNPVFFAVVLALLFGPVYTWLGRRGIPTPVALVIMLFGMTLLFVVIFYVLGASIARFSAGIGNYSSELNERLASIQVLVDRLGLANVKLREVVEPRALTGAVGVVLSGIAGFLSNLFLILAELGVGRALLVIAGVTVVNILAENVLSPMTMSRGLSISPTVVFLSFVFWAWLLGGPGAFLALPMTLFVAVMLDTFPETRWLADIVGISAPEKTEPSR